MASARQSLGGPLREVNERSAKACLSPSSPILNKRYLAYCPDAFILVHSARREAKTRGQLARKRFVMFTKEGI